MKPETEQHIRLALTSQKLWTEAPPFGSLMGDVCSCDDGFMCEHRREAVIRLIKTFEEFE
jgi:hypothetical protein